MATREDLLKKMEAAGVQFQVVEHAAAPTVEDQVADVTAYHGDSGQEGGCRKIRYTT